MSKMNKKQEMSLMEALGSILPDLGETFIGWIQTSFGESKSESRKPKRARTKKGGYRADDKSTKDVNEAWVGGKAPKKKK